MVTVYHSVDSGNPDLSTIYGPSFLVPLEVHMFIVRRLMQDKYQTANCQIPNGWTLDLAHIQPTARLQVLIFFTVIDWQRFI